MTIFPLSIFPEGALTSSVITTVWVGVWVVCFFNLRLGWVLSGLVVPGYVVPLLLIKPWSALVVFSEGILTYLIVHVFSEHFSKVGRWSNLFGRDRFFALFLVSIIVRMMMDGWLLPIFGKWLNNDLKINFDYQDNLHSFGLIVNALIANNLWRAGLKRGTLILSVTIFTTYLLVRYVLMEFTNFNISTLAYIYSDLASSILASPKAYIVLTVCAYLASRYNLLYGWDFYGILIPSLIALQWYNPEKILTTIIEATVTLLLAKLCLLLPLFKYANIEGARRILLFFNISFIYKVILGYFLIWKMPEVKVDDYYGFGYLLSTLIAIKIYEKNVYARLIRGSLQVSIYAVIVASLIGYGFSYLQFPIPLNVSQESIENFQGIQKSDKTLIETIRFDKIDLYSSQILDNVPIPLPSEVEIFTEALEQIKEYIHNKENKTLATIYFLLKKVNYNVILVENRYLYLREMAPTKGWGSFVVDLNNMNNLQIEVPAPLDEANTLEAGLWLFMDMNARTLAIAGTLRQKNRDGSSDVLTFYQTFYQAFHETFLEQAVLQIRGVTEEYTSRLEQNPSITPTNKGTVLWVKHALPLGLNVVLLKNLVEEPLEIKWDKTPFTNIQRADTETGFVELVLNKNVIKNILAASIAMQGTLPVIRQEQRLEGYLQDLLLSIKQQIAPSGSDLYQVPTLNEMLYFDEEVITPIINLIKESPDVTQWKKSEEIELQNIQFSANLMGYKIVRYHHINTLSDYILLIERDDLPSRKYWGTYAFRIGKYDNYFVQIPRPVYEVNTFEYGAGLYERIQGMALLIGGTHPFANRDYTSDILDPYNKINLFNLTSEVLFREFPNFPAMMIQVRALGPRENVEMSSADIIFALDKIGPGTFNKPIVSHLISVLKENGTSVSVVNGSPKTAGYEVWGIPQAMYTQAGLNKNFAIVWVSPFIRAGYRFAEERRISEAQYLALDIPSQKADLYEYIASQKIIYQTVPSDFIQALNNYQQYQDIIILQTLLKTWSNFEYKRIIDADTGQSFLFVYTKNRELILVANLLPLQKEQNLKIRLPITRGNIHKFVDGRYSILEFEGTL